LLKPIQPPARLPASAGQETSIAYLWADSSVANSGSTWLRHIDWITACICHL